MTTWQKLQDFLYGPRSLYHLALMRVTVCLALLGLYIWRQGVVDFFFTDEKGLILRKESHQLLPL